MRIVAKFKTLLDAYRHPWYLLLFSTYYKMLPASRGKVFDVLDPMALNAARHCLFNGEIIALPTDTVYGLACNANNEEAIQRLYEIKGRDCYKPVAICVKNVEAFRLYGKSDHLNDSLLQLLLPGPITIIIERSPHLSNRFLNPNTTKIGIRIPRCKFIQDLCLLFGEQPLALTSANRSAERSSLNIKEFEFLWPKLGGIFDAGQIGLTEERRSASTVIDLSQPGLYKIVREGVALKYTVDVLHKFNIKSMASKIV
ncbi:PREDICTED: yrdC domain-containing protein, mitochondrial [Rhagoletis zephyria]|uniref:yrdC domain-containing protein, mitochondrial n=1 Tax=Rhagoletis zephyria TaxID=28612 RepID=UPI0008116C8F|nr:PREDICTED: yrdC domain-containing protein, mitochondrial [Rhagoletis zephyria]